MSVSDQKNLTIVGLGNPGKKYELTRHNIGYLVVQAFARLNGWSFKEETRYEAQVAVGDIGGIRVHLLLPTTYMNESGRALMKYHNFFKIDNAVVLAVVDDIDIPFGMMRLREKGSAGGHNGLKSLEKYLGTQEYVRLRLGIDAQKGGKDLADHVLSRFSASEMSELSCFIDKAVEVLLKVIREGVPLVMNEVNKKITKVGLPQSEGQEKENDRREKKSL